MSGRILLRLRGFSGSRLPAVRVIRRLSGGGMPRRGFLAEVRFAVTSSATGMPYRRVILWRGAQLLGDGNSGYFLLDQLLNPGQFPLVMQPYQRNGFPGGGGAGR